MHKRTVGALATVTAAVTVLATLSAAPGAAADLIMYCIGTGGAVTVPTDLLVPPGESCVLTGTVIAGDVTIAPGANLVVSGGHIDGSILVSVDGYLDATDTTVGGGVVLASGGFGTFLRRTRIGSATVQAKGSATNDSFLFAEQTTVAGTVTADSGEIRLDRTSQVTGDVTSTGSFYTDVHDSFVDGNLSVRNSVTGSVVCGSAVRGGTTFAGNLGGVQLGPNGGLDGCASGGYWGSDVTITDTTGGVTLDDNIINGRLIASGNNPAAQVAPNNRIRGGVTGQQASAPAVRAAAKARAAHASAGKRRGLARRASAVRAAVAVGDAGL
jgi:hypothetical protein